MSPRVIHGDCLDVMRRLADEGVLVDSIVTDPPAGISFMGRAWDGDKGGRAQWVAWMAEVAAAALALAKPGAHALVWALPRTSHWTATAWEDAGWEVRERISHIFGTGFPKSLDVSRAIDKAAGAEREVVGSKLGRPGMAKDGRNQSFRNLRETEGRDDRPEPAIHITAPATDAARQWAGWGTALKPAVEDWWLLRKPLSESSIAANVLAHGTGALNIDGCRVETSEPNPSIARRNGAINHLSGRPARETEAEGRMASRQSPESYRAARPGETLGRWPANLCHDGSPEVLEAFAAQTSERTAKASGSGRNTKPSMFLDGTGEQFARYSDTGTAARFFYSAKASKADRAGSKHPTVKPVSLMRWLCRLVTPPGGLILDPFAGSGTTLQAAAEEGFRAIGIEREAEYVADCERRLAKAADLFTEAAA